MVSWTLRICGILFALSLFFGSFNRFSENREFIENGNRAFVEPIGYYKETTRVKTRWWIKLSETKTNSSELFFTMSNGQRIRIYRQLPEDVIAQFEAQKPVLVEYLPKSPSDARFVGQEERPEMAGLMGLLVLALTTFFWRKL